MKSMRYLLVSLVCDNLFVLVQNLTLDTAEELTDEEVAMLRQFTLKVESNMDKNVYESLRKTYPDSMHFTSDRAKSHVQFLAAYQPVPYDSCVNSCCLFVGPYENDTECSFCHERGVCVQSLQRQPEFSHFDFAKSITHFRS